NADALVATRNVLVATARTADGCRPLMRSPKRARQARAARLASGARRPRSSTLAPIRRFSRHVSRRKIWSPSTRPTSSRKLFEPMSTTASGSGAGQGRAIVRRSVAETLRLAPQHRCITFPRPRLSCYARRLLRHCLAMPRDYLQKILTAKVYDVAVESPLELAPVLSRRLGNRVLLKREDQQPVFSFKLRGAYNKMAHLSTAERARGVIAASAGNHAQGVALAAQKLDCKATIVMPVTTPHIKTVAVEALGAKVVLWGDSYSDAYARAMALQKVSRATFVHPYDDPDVIPGRGTVGMEILRQHAGPIDAIFVAVGGGGLISGIASYVKRVRPAIRIIGVQAVAFDGMTLS